MFAPSDVHAASVSSTVQAGGRADEFMSLAVALQQAADAIAVLDASGEVRYANSAFHALIYNEYGRRRCAGTRPLEAAAFLPLRTALQTAVAKGQKSEAPAQRCVFSIAYATASLDYVAVVSGIDPAVGGSCGGDVERLFLLVVREEQAVRRERVAALCQRYALSRAETRVLARFADGEDLAQIAISLGISIHTARIHMKVLLEKTACARQVELMRLLGSVATGRIRIEL